VSKIYQLLSFLKRKEESLENPTEALFTIIRFFNNKLHLIWEQEEAT
jgi:hypothetical protein